MTADNIFPLRRGGGADLPGGPGGGYDGGMPPTLDARVKVLEDDVKDLKTDVKRLLTDTSEIKGRLTNMPTTFQLLSWFVGVAIALVALTFTIARAIK